MKRRNVAPNEAVFTFLFEGLFQHGKYRLAHEAWRTALQTKMKVGRVRAHDILATACCWAVPCRMSPVPCDG